MIISSNPRPSLTDFQRLMAKTDSVLNADARLRPKYYATRGGNPLEDDVLGALLESSKGTPFERTIEKVSGQRFPDIVANKLYGVEVKSTKDDHWTSTGSSILESTRVPDVERIYMTFGKLGGNPIEFLSRPYEQCLYGIAVTHMPRYLIDMKLKAGETIFDKMGVAYDSLRKMDNPVQPVAKYYRSQLKPGESLWWTGDAADETVSATIRLWKNVTTSEKRRLSVYGCAYFPEVFAGDYDNYALWLTSQGIVDPHIRDQFSAGGQEPMKLSNGSIQKFPGVFRRVKENLEYFIHLIAIQDSPTIEERPPIQGKALSAKIDAWCHKVAKYSSVDYSVCMDALSVLFYGRSVHQSKTAVTSQKAAIPSSPSRSETETIIIQSGSANHTVVCRNCGKKYYQEKIPQMEGHRNREYDICPYCSLRNDIRGSMEVEYHNRPL